MKSLIMLLSMVLSFSVFASKKISLDMNICIADQTNYLWATIDSGNDILLDLNFLDLQVQTLYVDDNPFTECMEDEAVKVEGQSSVCTVGDNIVLEVDDTDDQIYRVTLQKNLEKVIKFERFYIDDNPVMKCM